jgi:sugar phosphate isomerase/epimerase
MRQIAISSPKFSHVGVGEMAPRIGRDFEVWEIVAEHLHHLPDIKDYMLKFLKGQGLKLQVHAPLSDINISAFSEKVRRASVSEVVEAIQVGSELGVGCVTFHPGLMSPTSSLDPNRVHKLARESTLEIAKAAKEFGVPVAIENMPRMKWGAFQAPQELLACIEGTEVGICFDAGHALTANLTDEYLALKARFLNVHLHDNGGGGDEHLILGAGKVPLAKILAALSGYRGNFVIECREYDDGLKSRDVLRRLLS